MIVIGWLVDGIVRTWEYFKIFFQGGLWMLRKGKWVGSIPLPETYQWAPISLQMKVKALTMVYKAVLDLFLSLIPHGFLYVPLAHFSPATPRFLV